MVVVQNIVWLLVLIGVMILIHELGHFWAARYYDVSVEVFSIGFGPRLFGFRRGETDYRLSAILFGGYVKFRGDQPGEEGAEDHPNGLLAKPRWQRLIVSFAGPFMNIVLAIGLLTGLFMVKFQKLAEPEQRAVIGHVIKDSAAAKAGLQEGDRLVAIDGEKDPTWDDIAMKEFASAYRPMRVTVERGAKRFETDVTPVLDDKTGVGFAGWSEKGQTEVGHVSAGMPAEKAGVQKGDVLLSANGQSINSTFKLQEVIEAAGGKPIELRVAREGRQQTFNVQPTYSNLDGHSRWMIGVGLDQKLNIITTKLSLPDAFTEAFHQNVKGASLIYQFLRGVLERRMSPKQLNGPIGIAQLSGDAAREGPSAFVHLMSMVSLNLAIFNLLPIPILDGGVIVLLLVEILIGRDLSMPVKEAVIKVGFVFLMVVTVFALYNDISKILPAG
jgi:regulator of sigma E protease